MKSLTSSYPINYRVLFIVFAICSLFGFIGLIASEIFMPLNSGGMLGRLAKYRSLGPATFSWVMITMWSWYQLRLSSLRDS